MSFARIAVLRAFGAPTVAFSSARRAGGDGIGNEGDESRFGGEELCAC